jgi:hypothetical protein
MEHVLWMPVVISSRRSTVTPSLASTILETEAVPFESSSPAVCSGTAHLPASPWKSPDRGSVSSWFESSHVSSPAEKTTFPSKSSGIGNVSPLSVDVTESVHATEMVV